MTAIVRAVRHIACVAFGAHHWHVTHAWSDGSMHLMCDVCGAQRFAWVRDSAP